MTNAQQAKADRFRAAMTGFLSAAYEVRDLGQFGFLDRCVTTAEVNKVMGV